MVQNLLPLCQDEEVPSRPLVLVLPPGRPSCGLEVKRPPPCSGLANEPTVRSAARSPIGKSGAGEVRGTFDKGIWTALDWREWSASLPPRPFLLTLRREDQRGDGGQGWEGEERNTYRET